MMTVLVHVIMVIMVGHCVNGLLGIVVVLLFDVIIVVTVSVI